MNFWTAMSDELAKVGVQSLNLEKVDTSAEHEAALDTNDDSGSKPKKRSLVGVMSMSTSKANGKDGGIVKTAADEAAEEAAEGKNEEMDEKRKEKSAEGKKKEKKDGKKKGGGVSSKIQEAMEGGDKEEEKKAGVIGRKIRGKLYGEHKELALEPHAYTGKKGDKRYALLKVRKYDSKGNKIKEEKAEEEKKAACKTPGKKIRSKGEGRGEGRGDGEGPIGMPIGKKIKKAMEKKAEDNGDGVRTGCNDLSAKKSPDGPMLETNGNSNPIGYNVKQRVY